MQNDAHLAEAAAADDLFHPAYWLASGLEWLADTDMSEAAVAIAPEVIPRDRLSDHEFQVLGCADLYARKHDRSVVFLSDLTRMFATASTSWTQLGVDWESALAELRGGAFPAMFLTISKRAHLSICNPGSGVIAVTPRRAVEEANDERDIVRQAIARHLATEWPVYMQRIIDAGRVSLAG